MGYLVGDGGGDERSLGNCNEHREGGHYIRVNVISLINEVL